jgi:hypothetical protein
MSCVLEHNSFAAGQRASYLQLVVVPGESHQHKPPDPSGQQEATQEAANIGRKARVLVQGAALACARRAVIT